MTLAPARDREKSHFAGVEGALVVGRLIYAEFVPGDGRRLRDVNEGIT